jgi:hypothetical protein
MEERTDEFVKQRFPDFSFAYKIEGKHRHVPRVYTDGKIKIIAKTFHDQETFERTDFCYGTISHHLRTPTFLASGERIIVSEFIEGHEISNPAQAMVDLAKLHSFYLNSIVRMTELFRVPQLKFLGYPEEIQAINPVWAELMQKPYAQPLETIVHGDMRSKNILSVGKGNYYIDFELTGVAHPTRDLARLLLEHEQFKDQLIAIYRKNIDFDYSGIMQDITKELLVNASSLLNHLNDPDDKEKSESLKSSVKKLVEKVMIN